MPDTSDAAPFEERIKLAKLATGVVYSANTGADDAHHVHGISFGNYQLSATANGFAGATFRNVAIELNQRTTANIVLRISPFSTQLDVTKALALIDTTTTAQVASTLRSRHALDLAGELRGDGCVEPVPVDSRGGRIWRSWSVSTVEPDPGWHEPCRESIVYLSCRLRAGMQRDAVAAAFTPLRETLERSTV